MTHPSDETFLDEIAQRPFKWLRTTETGVAIIGVELELAERDRLVALARRAPALTWNQETQDSVVLAARAMRQVDINIIRNAGSVAERLGVLPPDWRECAQILEASPLAPAPPEARP